MDGRRRNTERECVTEREKLGVCVREREGEREKEGRCKIWQLKSSRLDENRLNV